MTARVSILISTLNRAQYLRRALLALRYLDYDSFEVIVVTGPSEDHTEVVLEEFQDCIKIGRCPDRHVARSRNISLKMARGDFVAFLDDDSVPEPEWLRHLMDGFETEEVSGVGGRILDRDGISFQYSHILSDRFGEPIFGQSPPPDLFCIPFAECYPSLACSNSIFRRSAVMEVGGFDEEFEYHLEETDLCARLIDAGYIILQIPDADVHHDTAPSLHYRNLKGGYFDRYSFIKNHVYFALKHRAYGSYASVHEILSRSRDHIEDMKQQVHDDWEASLISREDLDRFEHDAKRAMANGMRRGLSDDRIYVNPEKAREDQQPFKQFPTLLPSAQRLCLCFMCRNYDFDMGDSALTFERELAHEAARRGHYVHVVTIGLQKASVHFENGVWVHRVHDAEKVPRSGNLSVPHSIWGHAYRMFREVERIGSRRRIDVVQWSILGLEGIAALPDRRYANVISLAVPGKRVWQETGIGRNIAGLWRSSARKSAERICLEHAPFVLARGRSVLEAVAERHGIHIPEKKVIILADNCSADEIGGTLRSHEVDKVLRFYQSIVDEFRPCA